jgi:signal transduction histidine kinase/CheY-like chemotaxis protein/HPt (histidine-containing phosphotransfer) domain-containing protein
MRSKIFGERHLKTKVFLSYALIIVLISFIVFFTFRSFQQITESSDELAKPNARIELLHDILFTIYNAESSIRSYTLSEQEETLNAYFTELSNINDMVDSLLILAGKDKFFLQMIDSVNTQLNKKTRLLEQFIDLKRLDENSIFYQRALTEIAQVAEGEGKLREITHKSIIDPLPEDTVQEEISEEIVEEEEKSSFAKAFNSLISFFSRKDPDNNLPPDDDLPFEEEYEIQSESVIAQQIRTDSIITVYRDTEGLKDDLESTLMNIAQSMVKKQQRLKLEENRILTEDKEVMDRIWGYVTQLEDYERANAIAKAEQAHGTVKSTTEIIFIIVLFSLLVLMAFSWLFVSDVNRSRFYRNQLMLEKNKAEELLQVKQRFMANISHEIRTPLNSIVGFSAQLDKIKLQQQHKTFVKAINQSSVHLLNMVNDILDFSKIEAGKIHLEKKYVNLNDLTEEIYNTLCVIAHEKKLEFSFDTDNLKHPHVTGDSMRIKQILLNIAGNALKFTEKGSVKIVLSDYVRKDQPDVTYVTVKVSDTGVGIVKADQKKIFDEFSQSDNQVTRKYGGTGLGLSISKKLVEIMGGSIELISKKGKGSTFTIHLPFRISQKPSEAESKVLAQEKEPVNARILVVEDDNLNRLLLKTIFSAYEGIIITEAADAQEGLKWIEETRFDLIITDIQMPGMSGIEMIKKMKSMPDKTNTDTPILAFTADITPETAKEILDCGINDYITKPVDENRLLNKIFELLSGSTNILDSKVFPSAVENHSTVNVSDHEKAKLYSIESLKRFTGNDTESLIIIIEAFISDTREHLLSLESVLKRKEFGTVYPVVHKMSNMFGILKVTQGSVELNSLIKLKNNSLTEQEILPHVNNLIKIGKELMKDLAMDLETIRQKVS